MNGGNGGPPGIQTWTNRYQVTLKVICILLKCPDYENHIKIKKSEFYYEELYELGIIKKLENGNYKLNPVNLKKHSVIVKDDFYDNMLDINWLREQRKKIGQIKGKVKDEEYRRKQQERRYERRQYAKQQKAKRLAKPQEELPLSDIIFSEKNKK